MAGNVLEYVTPTSANNAPTWFISPMSPEIFGHEFPAMSPGLTTNSAPGANGLNLIPLTLSAPFTISQFWWMNGSTTVGGNTLMGVYNETGTAVMASTALTANGATSTLQMVNITDVVLPPGRYWIALGTDSATHQYQRWTVTAPYADYLGIKGMVAGISGGALVTPLTFAVGGNTCFICGIMGGTVV